MSQLNIKLTEDFEKALKKAMKLYNTTKKSEAIRRSVSDAVKRMEKSKNMPDFDSWLGLGLKAPLAQEKDQVTEDDLWS